MEDQLENGGTWAVFSGGGFFPLCHVSVMSNASPVLSFAAVSVT